MPKPANRETIAIDIDDVVADSTEAFRIRVNEHTGANLSKEHYRVRGDYNRYYEGVWQSHGLDVDYYTLDAEMIEDQSHIPLLAGAEFAIGRLSIKFNVVLITARDPTWEVATKRWLQDNFQEQTPTVYFSEAYKDSAKKTKGEVCLDLKAKWLIDDNVEHCQSALSVGVIPILFGEYGWHHKAPKGITRAKNWQEVLEYFNERD